MHASGPTRGASASDAQIGPSALSCPRGRMHRRGRDGPVRRRRRDTTTTGGESPARGKRRERLVAARRVCEVVKEAAASRLGSRRKTARNRMQTSSTPNANRELHHRANRCRCHEPARGHFWHPVTLRCTNGSCTRTWDGQQVSPTDCEHPRSAPWEGISDASGTGSERNARPRERQRVQGDG